MKVSVRFEGGDQLAAALSQLSQRVSKNLLRGVLQEVAAPPIQRAAKARAPRAPGAPDMAEHIVVSTAPASGPAAAVAIGPSREARTDQPNRTYAQQGSYIEFGTEDTPMQPFMRPAFDEQAARTLGPIGDAIWRELAGRGISRPTVSAPSVVSGPGSSLA
jgi:HK97 gp10 family phage protein